MGNTTKIVFIGAGSMSFGLSMFRDLMFSETLRGSTLVLVDTDPAALARSAALGRLMNERSGAGLVIETTTDRRAALPGADFVLNATAIDRLHLWRLDFEIPKRHGIRQTLGENGGPGGLFFTLRTLPMVFDMVHDMEELCPDALFVNFSNPESRIILAVGTYSRIRAVGLCEGVFGSRGHVAKVMGLPDEAVDVWAAGLNHFQWLLQIRDHVTGADLYPRLRKREPGFDPAFAPLTRSLFHAFGLWPTCGDGHTGEYLPFGWEADGGTGGGYDFAGDEAVRAKFHGEVETVLAGTMPVPDWWLTPAGERGAAVIAGVTHNQKRFIESGVVLNRGAVPNLPADLAVEVPIVVDAAGVHPVSLGPLPDPIAKLLTVPAGVQQLAVEAAVHGSKELAREALLIDPVVDSARAADALLDELWEVNRPFIRACV
ncbi:alpha-glucosidase/alpha-galactosidase [Rhodoplanes roseus]|uniref:Alpha-glucosidase/alpha-galactosidase n=1 Tax=Rhodoplanes roseus TaxID=29409 RepID=A0A327KW86_9BRAD|nr:alpha-glucosidase/alpha-galactosidase [Rhodoplanes roseus]RAI43150.1 alpha-glucosidase/alpha-galactosidase [Rhodoplanes roseus]